jgi:hypothetical protein
MKKILIFFAVALSGCCKNAPLIQPEEDAVVQSPLLECHWIIPENSPLSFAFNDSGKFSLPAIIDDTQTPLESIGGEFKSQISENIDTNSNHRQTYFFVSASDNQEVKLSIAFTGRYTYMPGTADDTDILVGVRKLDNKGSFLDQIDSYPYADPQKTGVINIAYARDFTVLLNKGERLRIYVSPRLDAGEGSPDVFTITKFNRFVLRRQLN